eukprot:jgi/Astpho2/9429/Aster-x0397
MQAASNPLYHSKSTGATLEQLFAHQAAKEHFHSQSQQRKLVRRASLASRAFRLRRELDDERGSVLSRRSHRSVRSHRSGRSRRASSSDDDLEFGNGEERRHVKWYRNTKFWHVVASVLVTEALLVAAIIMVVQHNTRKIIYFETWRWLFFFAGFFPIYWISRVVIHLLVLMVETTAFTTKKAVYYTIGTRKPLGRFLRMLLLVPLFVGCFYGRANDSDSVKRVFQILAKVLGCLSLFFFGNVLKTFAAKAMSSHFHKEAHFEKMQEALVKEYYIMALSQPRQVQAVGDSDGSSVEDDAEKDAVVHSPAARMYHK